MADLLKRDLSLDNRPTLRKHLTRLGLKPPFPRSNVDCIRLIEQKLREIVKPTSPKSRPKILSKKREVVKPQQTKKTLKKLPVSPPEIPNNDTPNLNLIVKELTIIQRDYATKVPKSSDPEEKRKEKKSYTFKSYNLRTAISGLKEKFKRVDIQSAKEAEGIPRVGRETLAKIKEILENQKLERADKIRNDPELRLKESLMGVYGIGPAKANELITKDKITSLDHLRTRLDLLNDLQRVGIQYYDDINARIPYLEMKAHDRYLQNIIKEIDSKATLTIAGSYRRQKRDSGDIDVLLTHPDYPENLLETIIKVLHERGYLIATLVSGMSKYHGLSQLSSVKDCEGGSWCRPRRIDFLYCKPVEYPFSLLHFTGSGSFNQMIRSHALKRGLTLSEHGIKRLDGKLIKKRFDTEQDIFNFLEVEWIHPKDREHIPKF